MPFNRPSMPEIVERVATDIESRLPGTDARLRRSNLGVLGRVLAAVSHGLHGFIAYIARQVIPDTAEGEFLERWASIWIEGRTAATPAQGSVQLTGLNGVTIPAGTLLQRSDGAAFEIGTAVTIAAGVATAAVTAQTPGATGNTLSGTRLALAAQIMGVGAQALVLGDGITGGADPESDDGLRERMLFRIRKPPQGGADFDYEAWAREVAGVTRVWVKPLYLGDGTIAVFFVRDGDASMIPDAGEVAAVQAYIDARRPVTAIVTALAPTPLVVNMTISVTPDSTEVRAAVEQTLSDVFRRDAEPGGTLLISHLREAVSVSLGEIDHTIDVPGGNVIAGPGEMPVIGAITWI